MITLVSLLRNGSLKDLKVKNLSLEIVLGSIEVI